MAYTPILKVVNNTGANVVIADVGVLIPASSFDTFTDQNLMRQLATSTKLRSLVTAGTLTVNDGTSNIPTWQTDGFLLTFLLIGNSANQIYLPTNTAQAVWVTNIGEIWIDKFGLAWGYQAY